MFSPICNFFADLNVLSGAVFLYPMEKKEHIFAL